jgi:hypothetical protein
MFFYSQFGKSFDNSQLYVSDRLQRAAKCQHQNYPINLFSQIANLTDNPLARYHNIVSLLHKIRRQLLNILRSLRFIYP